MRITKKYLLKWINEQFVKFEMNHIEATEIVITRFRPDDYEGGACRMYVYLRDKEFDRDGLPPIYFMCFYKLSEYEDYINYGYEMYLKFKDPRLGLLRDLEIDLRKKI